jgi:hypothetical protein
VEFQRLRPNTPRDQVTTKTAIMYRVHRYDPLSLSEGLQIIWSGTYEYSFGNHGTEALPRSEYADSMLLLVIGEFTRRTMTSRAYFASYALWRYKSHEAFKSLCDLTYTELFEPAPERRFMSTDIQLVCMATATDETLHGIRISFGGLNWPELPMFR